MENTLEIKIKIKFEKISNDSYMNFEYLTSIINLINTSFNNEFEISLAEIHERTRSCEECWIH